MKNKRILFLALTFLLSMNVAFSQAKKQTPKKKSAPKAISVYICTNEKDKLFHKRRSCAGLNKCNNDIKFINSPAELKKWKRKSCPRCNK